MARGRLAGPELTNPEDIAMATILIEWVKHPTVKEHKVGKRSRMGEGEATQQIAKGRAKLVVEDEAETESQAQTDGEIEEEEAADEEGF